MWTAGQNHLGHKSMTWYIGTLQTCSRPPLHRSLSVCHGNNLATMTMVELIQIVNFWSMCKHCVCCVCVCVCVCGWINSAVEGGMGKHVLTHATHCTFIAMQNAENMCVWV